jgi:signal transduction histidine kinase
MTQISSQVALMEQFIQDMLTISRLEHLPAHHFEALDLNPLVDTVVAALRPRMEAKQLACLWRGQPNLPAVQGDQEQLRRMLMNLIENAVNYTPVGGQISIQTALIDERVGLEVSDSGIGIAAEELPQIFDRFYRVVVLGLERGDLLLDERVERIEGGLDVGRDVEVHRRNLGPAYAA